MGTTSKGIPYPESSDPVRQGAAAMQAIAEAVDPHIGAYFASGRRTDSGAFGSGSMTTLLNLSGPMPAGVYVCTYMWKLQNSANSTVFLRGTAGGSNLTGDETVNILTTSDIWTMSVPFTWVGGTLSMTIAAQVASGTCQALAGSRILVHRAGITI
jgi:hypothetical protein